MARSGSPSSLISMSAYGKQPLPQLHGQSAKKTEDVVC